MLALLTCSGLVNLERPDFTGLEIEDIAIPLSRIVRFAGNSKFPYTVAQHCLHVSKLVPENFAYDALMHDAEEAYTSDIPAPIKKLIGRDAIVRALAPLRRALAERFGLAYPEPPIVKHYDLVALATEIRDLRPNHCPASRLPKPDPRPIVPLAPREACTRFIQRFHELKKPNTTAAHAIPR